MANDRAVG